MDISTSESLQKPKNLEEYILWLAAHLKADASTRAENRYQSVTSIMKTEFEKSTFWKSLCQHLNSANDEYLASTGYQLLISTRPPEVFIKPFRSILDKSFRLDVLTNRNWPKEPPRKGWVTPENCYSKINDILRTSFVVKYLDGINFLIEQIKRISAQEGSGTVLQGVSLEARDNGYYAAHIYVVRDFTIPGAKWDTEQISGTVEIQIRTQLQDAINKLTHKYYEARRVRTYSENEGWQWRYDKEEFAANYLGHILHYVEGMIMDIRDKQRKAEKGAP